MDDPIRKPRKLRFAVSTALLISAPISGALFACGDDAEPTTNPVVEVRTNVPAEPEPPEPVPNLVAPEEMPPEPTPNVAPDDPSVGEVGGIGDIDLPHSTNVAMSTMEPPSE